MQQETEGYLLFSRKQGETSLWLSMLTAEYGRVSLSYKGGQNRILLQPFQSYHVRWQSKGKTRWLNDIELLVNQPVLTGLANWSGLYANQLAHSAMLDGQVDIRLFAAYQSLLEGLRRHGSDKQGLAWSLRRFEWRLLQVMGYAFPLYDVTQAPLDPQGLYQWQSDAWHQRTSGLLGSEIIGLADEYVMDVQSSSSAMRQLLQWRLSQMMPAQAMLMRQWWEAL